MSRSLYWKPHKPDEMQFLNKCVPLMDAIQNCLGCKSAILDQSHVNGLFWVASCVNDKDAEEIHKLIAVIKEYHKIEVEIRR